MSFVKRRRSASPLIACSESVHNRAGRSIRVGCQQLWHRQLAASSLNINLYKRAGSAHYFLEGLGLIIVRSQLDDGPPCWLLRIEGPAVHGWVFSSFVFGG
jgi:hypothetical protein